MLIKRFILVLIIFGIFNYFAPSLAQNLNDRIFQNSNLKFPNDLKNPLVLNVSDNFVRFFAIGDWGGIPIFPYRTLVQQNVANEMNKLSEKTNIHFNLALGDNFYFDGVTSVNDKRFSRTFEKVYKDQNYPWFLVLGNHDHLGNAYSQIEYTNYSKRWIMPDFNYSMVVNINNGTTKLAYFLLIDTVLLCGNSGLDEWSKKKILKFDFPDNLKKSQDYFNQIEEILKNVSKQNYPYVVVAGHYPVWSIAEHGPTQCLVDKLRPLLHKYNVSAYLAGHEHDLEHIQDTFLDSTVEYIISGASNIVYNSSAHINDIPKGSLKFYWSNPNQIVGAFCLVEADLKFMNITFLETSGKVLYKISIKNKLNS